MAENELSVLSQSRFLALQPGSDLREALEANLQNEGIEVQDLVRVPIPSGGATTWVVETIQGEEETKELVGAFVYWGVRGTLWPSEEPSDSRPVLVTNDLHRAYKFGDDYGDLDQDVIESCRRQDPETGESFYDWNVLPYNKWGTSRGGRGKRCKESRIICLLRENEAFPIIVNATPGSLKTVKPFTKKLPLPHFRCVISLSLSKQVNKGGQPYSRIEPRLTGELTKEEGAAIRQLYTTPLTRVVTSMQFTQESTDDYGEF